VSAGPRLLVDPGSRVDRPARPGDAPAVSADGEEAGWVESARRGERAAFGRLHARFAPLVHGVLLARVPPGEADDLVQEVFVRAWTRLGDLRDGAAFGPWVARIARNRAVDFHRRRRPAAAPLATEPARAAPPRAEAREALEAIRGLPEAYREPLVLRLVEGWTGPEIAARTGLTPGSVRVNLHRGLQLLRERLAAGDEA